MGYPIRSMAKEKNRWERLLGLGPILSLEKKIEVMVPNGSETERGSFLVREKDFGSNETLLSQEWKRS